MYLNIKYAVLVIRNVTEEQKPNLELLYVINKEGTVLYCAQKNIKEGTVWSCAQNNNEEAQN